MAASQIRSRTVWTVALHGSAALLVAMVAYEAREVLFWVGGAGFLALTLRPMVKWLQRRRMGRVSATLLVFALFALSLGLLSWTLLPMLAEQARGLIGQLPRAVARLREVPAFRSLPWPGAAIELREWVEGNAGKLAGSAFEVISHVVALAAELLTIFFLAIFMLIFGGDLFASLLGWIPPARRPEVMILSEKIERSVGGFILGTAVMAGATAVVTAIILVIAGVPFFLPLGILTGLLSVIPFVGYLGGVIIDVGVVLGSRGPQPAMLVAVALLVLAVIKDHLANPLVQRRTINMNPLLIAVVILVGASVGGILGAILALPVAGAAQVLLREEHAARRRSWAPPPATTGPSSGIPLDS